MSNTRTRKPGGGRKPSKPEYSAAKNLAQQMKAAADLYTDKMSLQAIADALSLNPIKVRKLLITAGVYESDMENSSNRRSILLEARRVIPLLSHPPCLPYGCPVPL